MASAILVVPCYNEAARLREHAFAACVQRHPDLGFIFVNDGSRDDTLATLRRLEGRAPDRVSVLDLPDNRGKAAAVREGMLQAFERNPDFVGYWDADLSTPLEELPRFIALLEERPRVEALLGARVKLLGRKIERDPLRHYMGRVFATLASQTLGLPVYDTQCGAKLFRASPAIRRVFDTPFASSWIFDVELLARMVAESRAAMSPPPEETICEIPLLEWVDVPGSKVRARDLVVAIWQLIHIRHRYLSASATRTTP